MSIGRFGQPSKLSCLGYLCLITDFWLPQSSSLSLQSADSVFLRVAVINCRPSVMNFKRILIANGVFNTTDRFGRITSGDASTLLAVNQLV